MTVSVFGRLQTCRLPIHSGKNKGFARKEVTNDMEPRELVKNWVMAFNRADADEVAVYYAENAVNHQVVQEPVIGRNAIREMFAREFGRATMVCQIENIFQDGDWVILEWKDPKGLRGCGFFHIVDDHIVFQRGYWNELSFLRQQGLPLPIE